MRFSLTQLLMLIALVGIGFAFWMADYGIKHRWISDIDYSQDGKYLAVTMYEWKDDNVPGKLYVRDMIRTIELIQIDGKGRRIVERTERPGGTLGVRRANFFGDSVY